jgi:glycerol-3-phosphate acyltransferase PlsX
MAVIAIDGMGGDYAPQAIVEGIDQALDGSLPGIKQILLVGDEARLASELDRVGRRGDSRIELVHADQVVDMHESPAKAVRSKRRSSINVAVDMVKQGRADAVISAGHTGAATAASVLKLRTLPGVERPAIATLMPSPSGHFLVLDVGSNVECKPIHLLQYAIMGDVYERTIRGKSSPRIGLISVGGETGKGNDLTKETFKLLESTPHLNFVGNIEGHDLFTGKVDVVLCDGFTGNVILKTCEGLAHAIGKILKQSLKKTPVRMLGALLSQGAFRELKELCDYAESGGAPLLGVNGVCIIGHGSSCPRAIRNAIRVAGEFVEYQVNRHIVERIEEISGGPEQDGASS